MNALLTKESVFHVMEGVGTPCVSIFMPTHVRGREIRQDSIRLKNLLSEAETQLRAIGLGRMEAEAMLKAPRALLKQALFWRHQSDGLALYCSPTTFRHYCLPHPLEELVVAAERFHIMPLLPLLDEEGRFYVLVLHPEGGMLFQGTTFGMREVSVGDIEGDTGASGGSREAEEPTLGGGPAPVRGKMGRIPMGEKEGFERSREVILQQYRTMDARLCRALAGEQAPLILAGPDRLLSLYTVVNSYPHRLEAMMTGNVDSISVEALHRRALRRAQEYFEGLRAAAAERYAHLTGTGRTDDRIEAIVAAALHGRVDTLFIGARLHRWGVVDPSTGACTLHDRRESGDRDLLNFAAVETLVKSGSVFAMEPRRIPGRGAAAAILRY